ncbi:MAG: nuclease [Pleurocapsa sp. SU_5_0]|nr:nuclease [Pleurocapsa sp. SU_5_0]
MVHNTVDLSNSSPDQELIEQLELATTDLLWFSEAEYPFQVIYWHDAASFTQATLLEEFAFPSDTKTVTKDLAAFFTNAIKQESWHNETEQTQVARYQNLLNLLTENLENSNVYLLGDIEISVYILGTTQHQAIAGLTTKIVAT